MSSLHADVNGSAPTLFPSYEMNIMLTVVSARTYIPIVRIATSAYLQVEA